MRLIQTISLLAITVAISFAMAASAAPADDAKAAATVSADDAKAAATDEKPPAPAKDVSAKPPGPAQASNSSPKPSILYRPPSVGKPAASVGGGTRGRLDLDPVVFALVPDHVGRTASAQPSLFWFVDRDLAPPVRVEFTLHADGEIEPEIEGKIPLPIATGIHRLRLSDYGVELEPGVEYEWSIAVVMNPDDPSRDIVATGWIERVDAGDLGSKLEASAPEQAARVYAEQGLWYDALTEVDSRIEKSAEPKVWSAARADLLKQVGLGVAADM